MNIIQKKWEFLNSTLPFVPKQAAKLYRFGLASLATRSVVSLRSNARLLSLNWNTAKSKAYRLTQNEKLIPTFHTLTQTFAPVSTDDVVCVDFSDFGNGFQVLMFAKQTHRGRALPLYFEILRYPIPKNSQNTFIMHAIKNFGQTVGCKPILVFDRGFAAPSLIRFLLGNTWIFCLRVKKKKTVIHDGAPMLMPAVQGYDVRVLIYDTTLRLVVSDRKEGMAEPWYLVTNDILSSRNEIIDTYYHRFEIEEFFRDAKRLFGLEWVTVKTERTLAILLWFAILGVWCLVHLESLFDALHRKERTLMRLSGIRFVFEKLQATWFAVSERRFSQALSP